MLPVIHNVIKIPNIPLSPDLMSKWQCLCNNRQPLRRVLSSLSSCKCLGVCIEYSRRGKVVADIQNSTGNGAVDVWGRKAGNCPCWLLAIGRRINWLLLFTGKGPVGVAVLSTQMGISGAFWRWLWLRLYIFRIIFDMGKESFFQEAKPALYITRCEVIHFYCDSCDDMRRHCAFITALGRLVCCQGIKFGTLNSYIYNESSLSSNMWRNAVICVCKRDITQMPLT